MAINLNKDYDDETLLSVFYKIMRDNLDAIVKEIEQHKTAGTIDHPNGSVTTAKLANGVVTSDKLSESVKSEIESKLDIVPVASETTVGGIKLHSKNGKNISGLQVYDDGTAVVLLKVDGGLSIDGAGQLRIRREEATNNILTTSELGALVNSVRDADHLFDTQGYSYGSALDAHLYAELHTYSTAPQRVGTWIDGTPIWRAAFTFEMKEYESTIDLQDILGLKDWFQAMFLDGYVVQTTNSELGGDTVGSNAHFQLHPSKESYEIDGMHMIRGWVKFVTPESNIISRDSETEPGIPDPDIPL